MNWIKLLYSEVLQNNNICILHKSKSLYLPPSPSPN